MQWEPVLAALAASDETVTRPLNVGEPPLGRIKAAAVSGRERVRQLRAMSGNDVAVAAAIMNSRDELIRELSPATFDDLQAVVSKRTEASTFKLPTPGKRVGNEATAPCRVEANFAKEPHLVPEHFVWEVYFVAKAGLAAENRLPDGFYPASFITGMRTGLRIQPSSMITLLDVASGAVAQVEALRSQEASATQIAAAVMNQRALLIRTLPRRDWAEIKVAAASVGARYFFQPVW
jgi:hypothetical protein